MSQVPFGTNLDPYLPYLSPWCSTLAVRQHSTGSGGESPLRVARSSRQTELCQSSHRGTAYFRFDNLLDCAHTYTLVGLILVQTGDISVLLFVVFVSCEHLGIDLLLQL